MCVSVCVYSVCVGACVFMYVCVVWCGARCGVKCGGAGWGLGQLKKLGHAKHEMDGRSNLHTTRCNHHIMQLTVL